MTFKLSLLWQAPELNPVNGKARSIPVLNPLDRHGRVFFFSWLGFMVAFLSWYVVSHFCHVKQYIDLSSCHCHSTNTSHAGTRFRLWYDSHSAILLYNARKQYHLRFKYTNKY